MVVKGLRSESVLVLEFKSERELEKFIKWSEKFGNVEYEMQKCEEEKTSCVKVEKDPEPEPKVEMETWRGEEIGEITAETLESSPPTSEE